MRTIKSGNKRLTKPVQEPAMPDVTRYRYYRIWDTSFGKLAYKPASPEVMQQVWDGLAAEGRLYSGHQLQGYDPIADKWITLVA